MFRFHASPAPEPSATHPWPAWIVMMPFLFAALGVVIGYGYFRPSEEPQPSGRKFMTREHDGRREVFAITTEAPEGKWLPLVEKTSSPLAETVPAILTTGEVVHVNADGTACITDASEASKRLGMEGAGLHGWPSTKK